MPFKITSNFFIVRVNIKEGKTLCSYLPNKRSPLKKLNKKIEDSVYDYDIDLSSPKKPDDKDFTISNLFIFLNNDVDLINFVSVNEDKINEETVADIYYVKETDKKLPQLTKICFSGGQVSFFSVELDDIDRDTLIDSLGKENLEIMEKKKGWFLFFAKLSLKKFEKLLKYK